MRVKVTAEIVAAAVEETRNSDVPETCCPLALALAATYGGVWHVCTWSDGSGKMAEDGTVMWESGPRYYRLSKKALEEAVRFDYVKDFVPGVYDLRELRR
jgi:hypothetical protein